MCKFPLLMAKMVAKSFALKRSISTYPHLSERLNQTGKPHYSLYQFQLKYVKHLFPIKFLQLGFL